MTCQYTFAGQLPLPRGIGLDAAGIVDAIGEGVTDAASGDSVLDAADFLMHRAPVRRIKRLCTTGSARRPDLTGEILNEGGHALSKNQREHIALITGASNGIGLALTRKMLSENWQVVALNRSDFPVEDRFLQNHLKDGRLRAYKVKDLTDYDSLRPALEEIKSKEQRIDILFNNAGGGLSELRYSKQGRELHYELLTVVPFIILMELKDMLNNGSLKTVINTSSQVFRFTKEFTIEKLEHPKTFRKMYGPYATSKLALSLWTLAIAPQLAKEGIKIRSVDPGINNTLRKGKDSGLTAGFELFMKFFSSRPTHGANLLYEGALGKNSNETGVFLFKDRIADLKFTEHAQHVLEKISDIYSHEFLGGSVQR